jgi:hypothetical protein
MSIVGVDTMNPIITIITKIKVFIAQMWINFVEYIIH